MALTLLVDHRHRAAAALLVEHQLAAARPGQQLRQALWRSQRAADQGRDGNQQDRYAHPLVHGVATPRRHCADGCRHTGEHDQGAYQPDLWHQNKPGKHDTDNPAQGV
ncbi:hypothetical protein D3C80_1414090 [compost metagenome]